MKLTSPSSLLSSFCLCSHLCLPRKAAYASGHPQDRTNLSRRTVLSHRVVAARSSSICGDATVQAYSGRKPIDTLAKARPQDPICHQSHIPSSLSMAHQSQTSAIKTVKPGDVLHSCLGEEAVKQRPPARPSLLVSSASTRETSPANRLSSPSMWDSLVRPRVQTHACTREDGKPQSVSGAERVSMFLLFCRMTRPCTKADRIPHVL